MSIATFSRLGSVGELGNQLFQVASTVGYAKKHGKTPIFPEWVCRFSGQNYGKIFDKVNQGFSGEARTQYPYFDLKYRELDNIEGDVDLLGYFQSEKYFKHCEDEIREMFEPNDSIKEYLNSKYSGILSMKDKVAVQIRTGSRSANDYDVHAYATKEFLERAQEHFDDDTFVIFADNMERAKSLLPSNKKYILIKNEKNYIDLFMMSMFEKFIVSASTFGWWGAWLSKSENPKVVMMENWFAKDKAKAYLNDNDIIPDRWIKISQ